LIRPDGTSETILRDSIVDQKRGKSAMPEELVQYLTPRELRDLVAYLAGLQADPMGVEPAD
jgi:quinoprotein glucose dehydrogenase